VRKSERRDGRPIVLIVILVHHIYNFHLSSIKDVVIIKWNDCGGILY
jgi:hypothetical protein